MLICLKLFLLLTILNCQTNFNDFLQQEIPWSVYEQI